MHRCRIQYEDDCASKHIFLRQKFINEHYKYTRNVGSNSIIALSDLLFFLQQHNSYKQCSSKLRTKFIHTTRKGHPYYEKRSSILRAKFIHTTRKGHPNYEGGVQKNSEKPNFLLKYKFFFKKFNTEVNIFISFICM